MRDALAHLPIERLQDTRKVRLTPDQRAREFTRPLQCHPGYENESNQIHLEVGGGRPRPQGTGYLSPICHLQRDLPDPTLDIERDRHVGLPVGIVDVDITVFR